MQRFPAGFRWGAATASYQIEGAVAEDGRGVSIWDTFSHTPGRTLGGDTGDVACDHYHRYRGDVAIMGELGLDDYRFSIAWPRVQPAGQGAVNAAGLDFYSRLVDELLAHGIRPVLTLYHWDLPQALQDAGGWAVRDTADRFADFVAVVAARLGDRVTTFGTLNEPWCSSFLGYASGEHAPGLTDDAVALAAAHHLLLAHGLALRVLRAELPGSAELSITLNPANPRPATATDEDREAAQLADLLANRIFLDPIRRGCYPRELIDATASLTDWGFVQDGDLGLISAPIEFLGVNYYSPALVAARPADADAPLRWPGAAGVYIHPEPGPKTGMDWLVAPKTLTDLLCRLGRDYPGVPIVITENGSAYPDTVDGAGRVDDVDRARYLEAHVGAVHDAITAGVDVRGYYAWSLLDNFEWTWGYSQRFGLVHVDYATQERRLKTSAHLFRRIIAAHGLPAEPDSAAG